MTEPRRYLAGFKPRKGTSIWHYVYYLDSDGREVIVERFAREGAAETHAEYLNGELRVKPPLQSGSPETK